MGIKGVPQTYEEFERTLDAYEDEHFGWDEGARKVSDATLALMASWYPGPLAPVLRKASLALLDDALLRAFRYERPGPVARGLTRGALRLRARAVRLLPPRSTAHYARQNPEIKGYPDGYEIAAARYVPDPRHRWLPGPARPAAGRAGRVDPEARAGSARSPVSPPARRVRGIGHPHRCTSPAASPNVRAAAGGWARPADRRP